MRSIDDGINSAASLCWIFNILYENEKLKFVIIIWIAHGENFYSMTLLPSLAISDKTLHIRAQ